MKSESYMRQMQDELAEALGVVEKLGEFEAKVLLDHGVASLDELAEADTELLTTLPGISVEGAEAIKTRAAELAVQKKAEAEAAAVAAAAEAAAEAEAAAAKAAAEAAKVAAEAAAEAPAEPPQQPQDGEA